MPEESGYDTARELLRQTFGQKFQIAKASIDSITNGPVLHLNDKPALIRFSAELTACLNTLKSLNYLHKLDNLDVLAKVVKRLPLAWLSGWQSEADSVIHIRNEEISIQHLADYISLKTRQCTNFSSEWVYSTRPQMNKKIFPSRKEITMATQAHNDDKICKLCNNPHYLNQCRKFRNLDYKGRIDFVNKNNLCWCCLATGHFAKKCTRTDPCKKARCTGRHTTLLHPPDSSSPIKIIKDSSPECSLSPVQKNSGFADTSTTLVHNLLPVVPVKVKLNSSNLTFVTQAFLDSGSTSSFITNDLIDQLKISNAPTVEVTTVTIHQITETRKARVINNLQISDISESNFLDLKPLLSVQSLPVSSADIPNQQDLNQFAEFEDIFIPTVACDVGLLIGNDNRHILQPHEVKNSQAGHYAFRTAVGWVVNCQKREGFSSRFNKSFLINSAQVTHPMCSLCTEVVDSVHDKNNVLSRDQARFIELVSSSICHRENDHYEIPLPVRDTSLTFPFNKSQAELRAQFLKRKLLKNPQFYEEYRNFITQMLVNGYAEKAEEVKGRDGKTWFIPHHGVYHKDKNKLRVVFDCSARYQGICLNDYLYQGPDLTNTLIGVLLRFRQGPIAIQGDIESMFYQIQVPAKDRDLLRFLWWEDGQLDKNLVEYRMCVYLFGAVCSPSCANFALLQTAKDFSSGFEQKTIETVKRCFYVDDCLASTSSVNEAKTLLLELQSLLRKGRFKITKWISNSREVMKEVPLADRSKACLNLDLSNDRLPQERSLGLCWDVEEDSLRFRVRINSRPTTRRGILSTVNSIYDPIGFGSPIIQPAKVLLQILCKLKLDWDEPIPSTLQRQWLKWLKQLPLLSSFRIPRCYFPNSLTSIKYASVHHFSDASEKSYGYVAYLRAVDINGVVHCSFLVGKTKLTPLKVLTIPRLELCAATISIKVDLMLREELRLQCEILPSTFWTDSTSVLRYVHNENKVFHTFVANRIQYIRDHSSPHQWKYVPSQLNPADDASRGLEAKMFLKRERWKSGPEFLWRPKSCWPQQPSFLDPELYNDPEVKEKGLSFVILSNESHIIETLTSKHSNWYKILRILARVIHFKLLFLKKLKLKSVYKTTHDLDTAETIILRYFQSKFFAEELKCFQQAKPIKRSSSIINLDPFYEDGLIKVGGRLKLAEVPYASKHPILLHNASSIVPLIIQDVHNKLGHVGRQHVLAQLRNKFWITKANAAVRRTLSNCTFCRKMFGKPIKQKMADLPKERLKPNAPPFSVVGLDYFGPFLTRKGRSLVKRYGVIFTCLSIRAVHIEVASSLNTSAFIQALRRFIARRGQVTQIKSDNGTNFIGGERELREAISQWNLEQIRTFLIQRGIVWSFNPPGASHFGGIWERQIKSIRKILTGICKEQNLTDESLITLMCEVESIINSRPITTISNDPNDLEPLTPNHLLLLKSPMALPPGVFNPQDCYSRKQWRQVQYLANVFWSRWIKEFLPLLQKRQKWCQTKNNLSVNDVVLVVDKALPRGAWCMGRVIEVYPDSNGLVRTARVRIKHSVVLRPISKLCLIDSNNKE